MYKVAIIEDEIAAAAALEKMISILEPDFKICAKIPSVFESLIFFKKTNVDLVFMDVQLSDGDCFELLSKIPHINFSIIFITAYDTHAIKAFKFNAIDYVLKPIDPEELAKAIVKAKERLSSRVLIEYFLTNRNRDKPRLALSVLNETLYVNIEDIIRLEADSAYTIFVLKDRSFTVSKNIKYYEDLLEGYNFIRIHYSHLVAKNEIASRKVSTLTMSNGDVIPMSVRKRFLLK
ncbi:response regulator [Flavobacterium sp. LC2016-23]|uniref:LytR/AlgR family response regulator transcription factor n=1 Tax=Flavobacterium sp. LC2016-23 TaxID=2666330 RepID=UPI0012B06A92|nr:LytTR family DNA-binding domain-containing protein [Flavobacterium sp. LC2016-23]MRX41273.1 response regulator [Flavobacterium sp. LC2016-23]